MVSESGTMDGLNWELPMLLAALGTLPYAMEALVGRLPRRSNRRRQGS
jgi:hypothetical protein